MPVRRDVYEYGQGNADREGGDLNVARGINEVFWFCAPCVGICIPITIFLVKKVTLNRSDDAVKKAEAKAWVESKKAKRAKKRKGSEETVVDSGASTIVSGEEKKRDGRRIGKEQ